LSPIIAVELSLTGVTTLFRNKIQGKKEINYTKQRYKPSQGSKSRLNSIYYNSNIIRWNKI